MESHTLDQPNYTFISPFILCASLYTALFCLRAIFLQYLGPRLLKCCAEGLFAGVWQMQAFIVVYLF